MSQVPEEVIRQQQADQYRNAVETWQRVYAGGGYSGQEELAVKTFNDYWGGKGFAPISAPPVTSNDFNSGSTLGATTSRPSYSTSPAVSAADAKEAAERKKLMGDIEGLSPEIDDIYGDLFQDLDALVKDRGLTLEEQYGEQLDKAGQQYTSAIPEIETSYAAIGADQSTDNTYAKNAAKEGFEDTTETIGKNKETDLAKLGQYSKEQRKKFEVDRDSARKNAERAKGTEDVDALRGFRNGLEEGIDSARVARSTLGTDEGARGEVSRITADSGRFEEASTALDNIIKSSVSGSTKEAAVKAIVDNAGLSDDEKEKVNKLYGNVYAEQAAL